MPKTIKKVPTKLPPEITSLARMFAGSKFFNQDLSQWDTSNIVDMWLMFAGAISINQDISKWNTSKVTNHRAFSMSSGIDNPNKLPKFKK